MTQTPSQFRSARIQRLILAGVLRAETVFVYRVNKSKLKRDLGIANRLGLDQRQFYVHNYNYYRGFITHYSTAGTDRIRLKWVHDLREFGE